MLSPVCMSVEWQNPGKSRNHLLLSQVEVGLQVCHGVIDLVLPVHEKGLD